MAFRLNRWIHHQRDRIRLNQRSYIIYTILRILVIVTAIRCLMQQNYEDFVLCLLSLFLFLLPSFFSEQLKISIPPLFEMLIYLFIFAAEILGEVNNYYTAIPGWDTMLHTINGFLCAAIGFSLIDILNRHSKNLNLSPAYLTLVAFCFSMTVGVLWEFIEFFCDSTFFLDMQKDRFIHTISSVALDPTHSQIPVRISHIVKTVIYSADGSTTTLDQGYLDIGLIDTMKDLFVNFIGAVVFSVIGYLYVKKRENNSIAKELLLTSLSDEELEKQEQEIEQRKQKMIAESARRQEQIRTERERRKKKWHDDAERIEEDLKKGLEGEFKHSEWKEARKSGKTTPDENPQESPEENSPENAQNPSQEEKTVESSRESEKEKNQAENGRKSSGEEKQSPKE